MPPRRYTGKIFLTAILFVLALPYTASAEQVIRAYSSHIEIKQDGSASVQEEIVYDFGSENFHGIYRVIPLSFKPIGRVEYSTLDISSIIVTDGHGNKIQTSYDKGGNSITLTIGEPSLTVTGPQLYVVHYTLWGAVSPNLVNDEFDWDSIGSDWQVPIEKLRTEVVFPSTIASSSINSQCSFIYDSGKSENCNKSQITATSSRGSVVMRFEATSTPAHTHFLVHSVFPKGAIVYRHSNTRSGGMFSGNTQKGVVKWWEQSFLDFTLVIPFIVFFSMLSIHLNRKLKVKKEQRVSLSQSYILTGVALIGMSFFVAGFNLAILLSGITIFIFGVIPNKKQ